MGILTLESEATQTEEEVLNRFEGWSNRLATIAVKEAVRSIPGITSDPYDCEWCNSGCGGCGGCEGSYDSRSGYKSPTTDSLDAYCGGCGSCNGCGGCE